MKRGPLKVFYSYAHEDEAQRDRIDAHLELLARQNLVVRWHDRNILPGTEWNDVISEQLASADIVLLLISRDFMASEYVNKVEIPEAMKTHESGGARVVPILIEEVPDWDKTPFKKLQTLPTELRPITEWDDPVEAYRDIARGIREIAKDIIIEGGGPFEFGAHEFTEAELASLPKVERDRTEVGLERLRNDLNRTIPPRSYESNLLVATWTLENFGSPAWLPVDQSESLFYIAQVITSFDLVALQKIHRDLRRLGSLVEVLGPDWDVLVTDVAQGAVGGRERFAFLYYKPRLEFKNFASQVILHPIREPGKKSKPVHQFVRPPFLAAFRSGTMEFQACTAHITTGGVTSPKATEARLSEIRKLGNYLEQRSKYEETDLLLLGDFQMGTRKSPILDALRESNVQIPDELLHPTNLRKNRYFGLIGFTSQYRTMPLGTSRPRSGTFDLFQHVMRDEDFDMYKKSDAFFHYRERMSQGIGNHSDTKPVTERDYKTWKASLVSNHLPLWVELSVESAED